MSLNPFEVRLEILKMAKDMLVEEYYSKREIISNNWNIQVDSARSTGATPPAHPEFPPYPTEAQIIQKANELNTFVSQIPATPEKTSKKST